MPRKRPITGKKARQAKTMLKQGKSLGEVKTVIGHTYEEVQAFAWDNRTLAWQGAKRATSLRLKKLRGAKTPDERAQLAAEIDEFVNYLYHSARKLQKGMESVGDAVRKYFR